MSGSVNLVDLSFIGLMICLVALYYVYFGYQQLLSVLAKLLRAERNAGATPVECLEREGISVYLSVLNGADQIEDRLENIFDTDFPNSQLEVIIFSDGSTDNTCKISNQYAVANPSHVVRIFDYSDNVGQYRSQNAAAEEAKFDILLSTDLDARFENRTITEICGSFRCPRVGVAGAKILYDRVALQSAISSSYQKYRGSEHLIRQRESALGVGVKVDGPCMAYRKLLHDELQPWEDVDQVMPMIARKAGYKTVHVDSAICHDVANLSGIRDLKQRSRMTRKACWCLASRWKLKNVFGHPLFTLALISHKYFRFLSPAFLILGVGFGLTLFIQLLQQSLVFISLSLAPIIPLLFPLGRKMLGAFLVANAGFLWGLITAVTGEKTGAYSPTNPAIDTAINE